MGPITIELDVAGFIFIIILGLQALLTRVYDFKAKHGDQINAICIQLKGLLEIRMGSYFDVLQDETQDSQENKDIQLESIINDINKLSNEYYDWNHLNFKLSRELRNAFLLGVILMVASLAFFISTEDPNIVNYFLGIKILIGSSIVYLFLLLIVPVIYRAYYELPNKIDKKYQEMRDGDIRSWQRV